MNAHTPITTGMPCIGDEEWTSPRDAWEEVDTAMRRMKALAHSAEYVIGAELRDNGMARDSLLNLMYLIEAQVDAADVKMKTVWAGLGGSRED